MSRFTRNHRPGQGAGYKPPMDRTVFTWFCVAFGAIAVLAIVVLLTAVSIHAGG